MKEDLKKIILSQPEIAGAIRKYSGIGRYVDKISQHATIIPYYHNAMLNGFIAFYANDTQKKEAYLTLLIIDSACKGQGLGKLLLDFSIADLKKKDFHSYRLEVSKSNEKAILLYKNAGFVIESESDGSFLMNLSLRPNAR